MAKIAIFQQSDIPQLESEKDKGKLYSALREEYEQLSEELKNQVKGFIEFLEDINGDANEMDIPCSIVTQLKNNVSTETRALISEAVNSFKGKRYHFEQLSPKKLAYFGQISENQWQGSQGYFKNKKC